MRRRTVEETIKTGNYYTNRKTLSMVVSQNSAEKKPEVAIAVKKTIGNAVARNRIRRRLKAAFDQIKARIIKGANIVIFPIKSTKNGDFDELKKDLVSILKEAELL